MRSWLLIALSIATQFSAFANEGTAQKNGGKQKEGIITRVGQEKADKGNRREFQIDFEFSMEQQDKNGDLAVEGKTIPGSTTTRTETTLDLSDGQLLPLPAVSGNESTSFEIKITSLENDMVRLAVSAKQSRKVSIEAGEYR